MVEEILIEGSHIGRGRAVDKHRVEDVHADDFLFQSVDVTGLGSIKLFLISTQVDAVAIEDGFLRRGNAHHLQLQLSRLLQLLVLRIDLLNEVAAHSANAADEEVEHLVLRKEERVVDDVEGLAQVFCINDKRDVGLGCALCAGNDTDARTTQRAEQFTRNARRVLHVLTHDGDGCQSALGMHGEHGARHDLFRELHVQHLDSTIGILVTNTDRG